MIRRLLSWFGSLPATVVAGIGVLLFGLVAGGGYYAFRTFEYVEHDNEFCLSCHLMQDPYDRFAESEHQGLGCKACHKPTFGARSQMALTQIIENPDELAAHAEVLNEKCEGCHVDGDPETWRSIRSSAGHRIHLESADTTLQGLMCVECHSSSLHEFAPSDRTCAQSGCHTDVRIQLAGMSDLTIHCAACHAFNAPVSPAASSETVLAAVRPDAGECLSCHAMRVLVEMPPDEPHGGVCGSCHNAHEQATPEEAVTSCATAGCHEAPADLTPFHRGLGPGALEGCTSCHQAHGWEAAEGDCLACHQDIYQDAPSAGGPSASADPRSRVPPGGFPVRLASSGSDATLAGLLHAPPPEVRPELPASALPAAQVGDTAFLHSQHRGVDCLSCHTMEGRHGALTITALADCRSCHHTAPVASDCASCHTQADRPSGVTRVRRTLEMSVARPTQRDLPFDHADHGQVACGDCHTGGLELSAAAVSCTSCHEEHHRVEQVRCASCHVARTEDPHTTQVHVGCTGSGCHTDVPFQGVPRARAFCVTCHQDMEEHRAPQACEACHSLPEPRGGAG
jgi:hypothetical protein